MMMQNRTAHDSRIRLYTLATLLLILVALLGVQLLITQQFSQARELRAEAGRIVSARTQLSELQDLHFASETGVRAFLLTDVDAFLVPYERAIERREAIFLKLQEVGQPSTRARLDKLKELSDLKFANAARNLVDAEKGRPDLARARVAAGQGQTLMERITTEIRRLDALEAEALRRLEQASEDARSNSQSFISLLLVGIAVLLIAATLLLALSISQRRDARAAERQVAEQESAIFDGMVDGVLLLDAQGNILRANPSVVRMFQFPGDELIGRGNGVLMAQPFRDAEARDWLARVGDAEVDGAGRRQEFLGKRADGTTFETEVAVSRFGAQDNPRYVAVIRDITDRKRADRMKNDFVATVSHELRTPLTSIGGALALLESGAVGELSEKAARLVKIAHTNCERLIRLINDLLDIEKIEAGKMSFDMRKLNLGPVIDRAASSTREIARKQDVAIDVVLPPWPQCVNGDPDRLEQVLVNLLSNAIKYSPSGESVEIRTVYSGDKVRVEVGDRGDGVPMDFRERIFSKFAMADSSDTRTRGGTGLGLSIARQIVEYHGGTAGFYDRNGGGTVFWFELPLVGDDEPLVAPEHCDLPVMLHFDNDLDCQSVVASAFAGRASVMAASSLNQARAILYGDLPVMACIIETGTRDGHGLDLVAEVRSAMPRTPLVLFTALDEDHARVGADAVFMKSKTPMKALVETTMALVGRSTREG